MSLFGKLIRDKRLEKKISLFTLAESLGVSTSYLSDIERGNRPPFSAEKDRSKYELLSSLFDQSIDYLLEIADQSMEAVKVITKGNNQLSATAVHFARKGPELTREQLERIDKLLAEFENV